MANLLRADFRRYYTSAVFYAALAATVAVTVFRFLTLYSRLSPWSETDLQMFAEGSWGNNTLLTGDFANDSAFSLLYTAFFMLRERQGPQAVLKIAKGVSPAAAYLSDLAVCCSGAAVFRLAAILSAAVPAAVLRPGLLPLYLPDLSAFSIALAGMLTGVAAVSALAVFLSFFLPRYNFYLILFAFILLSAVAVSIGVETEGRYGLYGRLSEPEYISERELYGGYDGEADGGRDGTDRLVRDPMYVGGAQRVVSLLLTDGIPAVQDQRFGDSHALPDRAETYPLYNAASFALILAAGLTIPRIRERRGREKRRADR